MDYGFCPRCGVRRPDAFRWCRKCGFDFENPPKPEPSRSPSVDYLEARWAEQTRQRGVEASPSVERLESEWAKRGEQRHRVDVRPIGDRRDMAEWTRDAFTVRCLGTAGGMIGGGLGFVIVLTLFVGAGAGFFALPLAMLGALLGFFLGVRFALGLAAK